MAPPTDAPPAPADDAPRVPVLDAATRAAALAQLRKAWGGPYGWREADGLALLDVATAAVLFTSESIHQKAPWWWLDDSCLGCGCDAFSWEILAHDDDCPALALDAALARLATGGTDTTPPADDRYLADSAIIGNLDGSVTITGRCSVCGTLLQINDFDQAAGPCKCGARWGFLYDAVPWGADGEDDNDRQT